MKLDPLPLNQVFTLSRDEFALYIEQARKDGLDSIFDVDFSRMSDEQALLILDVLFKNKKKRSKTTMNEISNQNIFDALCGMAQAINTLCGKFDSIIPSADVAAPEAENDPAEAPFVPAGGAFDNAANELEKAATPQNRTDTPFPQNHYHESSAGDKTTLTPRKFVDILKKAIYDERMDEYPLSALCARMNVELSRQGYGTLTSTGIRYALHMYRVPLFRKARANTKFFFADLSNLFAS